MKQAGRLHPLLFIQDELQQASDILAVLPEVFKGTIKSRRGHFQAIAAGDFALRLIEARAYPPGQVGQLVQRGATLVVDDHLDHRRSPLSTPPDLQQDQSTLPDLFPQLLRQAGR